MKTLAKALHKEGKENTKLYKSIADNYRANTSIKQDDLTKEVRSLDNKQKRQLTSMKFSNSPAGIAITNAISQSKKANTGSERASAGERY